MKLYSFQKFIEIRYKKRHIKAVFWLATSGDYLVVVPFTFGGDPGLVVEIERNAEDEYQKKIRTISAVPFGGGTDMYEGIEMGL